VKGALFLALPPLLEQVFSLGPWLLLNLTGFNWSRLEILEKVQDRQTDRKKIGVRHVVRLAGDAQPSLLLFSILIL
jgi:hypothetical protein